MKVWAAGLTYKSHIKQSGESIPKKPVFFEKNTLPQSNDLVILPTHAEVLKVLGSIDPYLPQHMTEKFGTTFPLLLDYEVEVALLFREDVTRDQIESQKMLSNIGWVVANDYTLRTVQILGEGQDNKMQYWSAAKSFPTFLHVHPEPKESTLFLHKWPSIVLYCDIGGQTRQEMLMTDMVFSPRQLLLAFMDHLGTDVIKKDTMLLTGTPAGCALRVSSFKKFFADLFRVNRFTKLKNVMKENQHLYLKKGSNLLIGVHGIASRHCKVISIDEI